MRRERDYLERTIATVRNHRDNDTNCWPQWANIFADEIERLWKIEEAARALYERVEMDESAGVCLTERVEALTLGDLLAARV